MTFSHVWMLHLLWLVPIALSALIVYNRRKKKSMESFADPALLTRLAGTERKGAVFLKGALLLTALGIMLFSLAGPRWGSHYQEVSQKGVDILILLDVSPSMLVEDIKPDRLEQARREILDLLHVLKGDRVGLVLFSGMAFVQCPLTLDYGALHMFLNELSPDLIPVPGTDIGEAIQKTLSSFDYAAQTDKVIILITDGEDNEGNCMKAAQKACDKGVKIFVFGIGDTAGAPVPSIEEKSGFAKDKEGNIILSKLDEENLRSIARVTDGIYTRSVTGDIDLDVLYFDGIKSKTDEATLKSGKIKVYEERFAGFLLIAFFCLLFEDIITERKPHSN